MNDPFPKTGICSICNGDYGNYGNNPWPMAEGRCCDACNWSKVIPARIALHRAGKKAREQAND